MDDELSSPYGDPHLPRHPIESDRLTVGWQPTELKNTTLKILGTRNSYFKRGEKKTKRSMTVTLSITCIISDRCNQQLGSQSQNEYLVALDQTIDDASSFIYN